MSRGTTRLVTGLILSAILFSFSCLPCYATEKGDAALDLKIDRMLSSEFAPGEVIVTFRCDVTDNKASAVFERHGFKKGSYKRIAKQAPSFTLRYDSRNLQDLLRELLSDDDILSACPNYIGEFTDYVPNDPMFPDQWNLWNRDDPSGGLGSSCARAAWDTGSGDNPVLVAVIDTGIDSTHEDLQEGRVVPGWNFFDDNADCSDLFGHGTHVAGIIAANANDKGIVGVAGTCPNVMLMPLVIAHGKYYDFNASLKAM